MRPLCIFLALLGKICQVPAVSKTSGITQHSGVQTAEAGKSVTLECFCQDDAVTFLSWYQQSLGGKPLIISTRMKQQTESSISPAYKERFRVLADHAVGSNHLIIKDLRLTDSATYYCGILEFNAIKFGQGAFLHVKTSLPSVQAAVHQPALGPVRLGDSVNLICTVHAEKCAGEQSFYWFRHDAAQQAIIYHGEGQCENLEESRMENCTLNLAIESVSSSEAGMYYCALASCGEIVFGNGTRVEIAVRSTKAPLLLVHSLSVALGVSIILLLVLAFIMHKLKKNKCSACKGTASHLTCSAASDAPGQEADVLHYAAVRLNRTNKRPRQEESVCVYSQIKSRKEGTLPSHSST